MWIYYCYFADTNKSVSPSLILLTFDLLETMR